MKKLLSLTVILMTIFALSSSVMMADTPPTQFTVIFHTTPVPPPTPPTPPQQPSQPEPEPDPDEDDRRVPARPISCTISSEDGIDLPSYVSDIYSYEIWNADGTFCMAAFIAEEDFIDFLFSITGDLQLRFVTDEYMLVGYVSL